LKGRLIVAGAFAAAAVALAPSSATADTSLVGSTTLAANSGAPALFGQGVPVFQGDASANYVPAVTVNGTITSWSFRTAGVDTGNRFELAVLSPVDTTGADWRLTAVSPPEAVTSPGGTDAIMGPFTLSTPIAVQPGDRIALEPIDAGNTPIEQGVNGADGIRYFADAFAGGLGSSQTIAPGSSVDNGQVVPIQATVDTGITTQKIRGTPKAGQTLACDPGDLAGSPGVTETWFLTTWTVEVVGTGKFLHVVLVPHTSEVATGPSYVVPDLPAGDVIGCTVTAGPLSGTAADVTVIPTIPQVALGVPHPYPQITPGVGFGGTNYCTPGAWLHFPTSFSYGWYIEGTKRVGPHNFFSTLVGTGQTITIGSAEEQHHLVCRVTARNGAGSYQQDSNNYLVPQHAPKAAGLPRVKFLGPECELCNPYPSTTAAMPLLASNGIFFFSCTAPKFDSTHLVISYSWEIDWPEQSLSGGPLYPGGTVPFSGQDLDLETTAPGRHAIAYVGNPSSGMDLGEVLVYGTVKCIVRAHPKSNPNAETDLVSKLLYFREGSG
jgi:hypothetical protein